MYRDEILILFLVLCCLARPYEIEVEVSQGKIIGTRDVTVFDERLYYAFYAVPYAQPPLKKLRFKDPKPVKKWKQALDARTDYHGACAQAHIVHKNALYGFEDCLNLNVYTPLLPRNQNEKLKPVAVWIHGYAFTSSFSHIHGADFFIDNDIVFVTLTHRIGVFGFLKLNETDTNANMGIKDIVMGLKWIRKNIKKFGGDKDKITVMGCGSAATYLSLLLMTKSRKLFSKIILQSGAMFSPSILQANSELEKVKLTEALRKITSNDIKKASTKDIIIASQKIYSNLDVINFHKPLIPFTPILEKKSIKSFLLTTPDEFYANVKENYFNTSILIGYNSKESISEVIPFIHNPHYLKSFSSNFKFIVPFAEGCKFNFSSKIYKVVGKKIKARYFKDGISENSVDKFLKYTSDLHKYPIHKFIKTHLKVNTAEMYVYKFNYVGKFNAVKAVSTTGATTKVKGASNGDEVCYIMKCEPLVENYVKISQNITDRDRIFIKNIVDMWANFIKTGNPTPTSSSGNTIWLPMTLKDRNIMLIGKNNILGTSKSEEKMFNFWNDIYNKYYSKEHCGNKHEEL